MSRTRRRIQRSKRRPSKPEAAYRSNPPALTEIAEFVLPGFAAFAGARFLTRIVATQVNRKRPTWGKHAGAATSVITALAAMYGAGRVKQLAPYHTPVVVGTSIAALQSLIQLYFPKFGWMISDASDQLVQEAKLGAGAAGALPMSLPHPAIQAGARQGMHLELLDEDPDDYSFNDSFDAGRAGGAQQPAASAAGANPMINDDLSMDDLVEAADLGSLAAN